MEKDSRPRGIVLVKPIEQKFSGDGTTTTYGVHVFTDNDNPESVAKMAEEAMRIVAEKTGMGPIEPGEGNRSFFGFSNWEGSEWQPQGPKVPSGSLHPERN